MLIMPKRIKNEKYDKESYEVDYPMSDIHHTGVSWCPELHKNITPEEYEQFKNNSKGDN